MVFEWYRNYRVIIVLFGIGFFDLCLLFYGVFLLENGDEEDI